MAALALPASAQSAGARSGDRAALELPNGTFDSPAVEEWYRGCGTCKFVLADGRWSMLVETDAAVSAGYQPWWAVRAHLPAATGARQRPLPAASTPSH